MRNPELDKDRVVLYIGDHPFTMTDMGDLLDENIRTVFQSMIDRGMIPGVVCGTPWHTVISMDDMESLTSIEERDSNELLKSLAHDRDEANVELVATYTPEAREKARQAHRQLKMAKKLVSD